jgi:hypothetical protein
MMVTAGADLEKIDLDDATLAAAFSEVTGCEDFATPLDDFADDEGTGVFVTLFEDFSVLDEMGERINFAALQVSEHMQKVTKTR